MQRQRNGLVPIGDALSDLPGQGLRPVAQTMADLPGPARSNEGEK